MTAQRFKLALGTKAVAIIWRSLDFESSAGICCLKCALNGIARCPFNTTARQKGV